MTLYDLPAPAKLNLFLHIVGRRQDGYHLLESLFRLVSLSDSVTIDLRSDGLISRQTSESNAWPAQDDLVVRAAKALQRSTGVRAGAHIAVEKRIPVGGGLGGGSSDAATVLLALNRLWRTGLTRAQLMQIALPLGADVPFFLLGQAAFVTGIGEQLQPLVLPDQSYLVYQPSVSVPTAAVFGAPDLTRDAEPVKISDFSGRCRFMGTDPFGCNNLEPVVLKLFPAVRQAQQWLLGQGFESRLTGSGACLFSEFDSPLEATLAYEQLLAKITAQRVGNKAVEHFCLHSVSACDGLLSHPLQHWVVD